eukprot:SM000044S15961  [mRNA]  locus=s44:193332:193881:- [translate_table: standard]
MAGLASVIVKAAGVLGVAYGAEVYMMSAAPSSSSAVGYSSLVQMLLLPASSCQPATPTLDRHLSAPPAGLCRASIKTSLAPQFDGLDCYETMVRSRT